MPDLAAMSSGELIQLMEAAQQAYTSAIERERIEAATAQQQLIALAERLQGKIPALTALASAQADGFDPAQAVRTIAGCLAEVTDLARQSVLIGAQASTSYLASAPAA